DSLRFVPFLSGVHWVRSSQSRYVPGTPSLFTFALNPIRPASPLVQASLVPSLALPFSNPYQPPLRVTSAAATLALKKTTWPKPPTRSDCFSLLAFPRRTNSVFSTPPPRKISADSSCLRSAVPFLDLHFRSRCASFTFSNSKLVFPSSVASAYTIRSLHVGKGAALDAKRKTEALILSFCFAITLRVVSEYALWDWHLLYMLSRIGWTSAINAESWGWIWEWTPASIGAGMLTGINTYSFLGGSFLAWAIIGPIIVSMGKVRSLSGFHRRSLTHAWAFGIPANPNAPGYMNYASM
ncbi:hypothetical protein L210DRAFT_3718266, partial [Boletus edulis BED1]